MPRLHGTKENNRRKARKENPRGSFPDPMRIGNEKITIKNGNIIARNMIMAGQNPIKRGSPSLLLGACCCDASTSLLFGINVLRRGVEDS